MTSWRVMGGLAKSCRQFRRIEDVLVHRSAVPLTAPTDRLSGLRIRPLNSTRRYATTPNTAQKEVLVAEESALVQKAKKKRKPAARKSLAKVAMEAQRSQEKEILTNANDLPEIPSLEKTVRAYCVAEEYDMLKAEKLLSSQYRIDPCGTMLDPEDPPVLHIEVPALSTLTNNSNPQGDSSRGDVFIFPSGTLVAWNVSEETIKYLTSTLSSAAETPLGESFEEEDMKYIEDITLNRSSIRGDTILLGTGTSNPQHHTDLILTKIAFSSGLARSVKLAVIEESLSEYFSSTRSLPKVLSRGTFRSFSRSFVYQKLGQLLDLRAQLNLYSEITDSLPDLFWDTRLELGLETYYDQVSKALDAGIRIKTLNQKMDYAQEIASVLKEKLSEKNSARLEWIIIILIAVEVSHVFWMEYGRERRKSVEVS